MSYQAPAIKEEKTEKRVRTWKMEDLSEKCINVKSVYLFQDETEPKVPLGKNNVT